ncbi:MAG: hypothetical protein J6P66_04050 [Bacteroidaceae bacterium]|nr:hypothetical protein [Bacteroidaceae bacterium]
MKKRDLLLAGLFLCSVSSYAQEPVRYQDDAKVIFFQDFEGNDEWQQIELNPDPNRPTTLYTWEDEPIDQIEEVAYFKKQDSKDKDTLAIEGTQLSGINILDGSRDWEIAGYRDTVIDIWNGVVRTDAKMPDDSVLAYDSHRIVKHDAASLNGTGIGGKDYGLSRYGEQEAAKKTYFSYVSASGNGVANWSSDNKAVPEYRRNLFIRLNPGDIEPNSSYRVTVFVKATPQAVASEITPRLGLQLMHGFFHAEKDFLVDTKNNNEFSTTTDYTEFEEGKWQKITLMSYYLTDSIAHYSAYNKGYWWPDDWVWVTEAKKDTTVADEGEGDTTMVFRYIMTPDKFFVRMSFRSDSTRFDVDNLSLTKSWIGGVEHYGDMIRVDFGYKTNLGQLAEQAKKINKIATVEVPGKYFEVWANFGGEWEEVPILSAEYQGDGYMYMWTEPLEDGSANELDEADEVLVTFRNPRDREDLFLAYTGNQYPNGLDSAWVAEGKKVFDFHNEISSLNPTITVSPVTGKKVMSLKNLPPVMQYEPYEEGTFALPTDLKSMTFKFSRQLAYDKTMDVSTNLTLVTVKKGGTVEYWDITESDKSGYTTITRPAKYTDALAGDYVFSFKQVTHMDKPDPNNPDHFGDDVAFNYHFGDFKTDPKNEEVTHSDWRNEDYTEDLASGQRYYPLSIYVHSGQDPFTKGTGGKSAGKCGLYTVGDEDCQIYFSNRGKGNSGNVYTIENLDKGNYSISFRAITWGSENDDKGRQCKLYVYAKPEGELENGNDKGFAVLEAATKTLIGTFAPSKYATSAGWPDGTETFEFPFNCSAKGDYVFEWVDAKDNANSANSYHGFAIGNYSIKTAGDLSFIPVKKLNDQIAVSEAKLAEITEAKYKGAAYNDLSQKITDAKAYNGKVKAAKLGVPSKYDSVVATLDAAVKAMDLRVDTVKLFDAAITAATTALSDETYKSSSPYAELAELTKEAGKFDIPAKTSVELAATVADLKAGIAKLQELPFATRNIRELDTLSQKLGSDIDQKENVKAKLAELVADDAELATILKAAIVQAVYEKAAAKNEIVDSLALTPFIKNYFLYSVAKVGDQLEHFNYTYGAPADRWRLIGDVDYVNTVFPGWKVRSTKAFSYATWSNQSTNVHIGGEGRAWDDPEPKNNGDANAAAIFDANLAVDWTSSVTLTQTVNDLPAGYYNLGINIQNGVDNSHMIGTADGKEYDYTLPTSGTKVNMFNDSIVVTDGKLDIKFTMGSASGWSYADDFQLIFRPLDGFDYAAAAAAQKDKVDELITVVNAAELKVANVELFSLGGMKIDAPKAGQVVIRKTTQSNGKIVVDKVLVK